jgi:tellurite resistance protein TehA-like permease
MSERATTLRRAGAAATVALLGAPAMAAAADGEGLVGRTTVFEVTLWGFGVIALFMILPIVLSLLQARLDTRKERAREQLDRVRKP